MTRSVNARLAGFAFLFYIAAAYPALVLERNATNAEGTAAKLALVAQHAPEVRLAIVLSLLGSLCALVLAVTLYGITREEDRELALLGMACRVAEGVLGGVGTMSLVGVLRLATAGVAAAGAESNAAAAVLLDSNYGSASALFFVVGSTVFAYLLLRGRIVPAPLAWLGLVASAAAVPLQLGGLVGLVGARILSLMWLPVGVFELALAAWLLVKGAAVPARQRVGAGLPARPPAASPAGVDR